MLTILPFQKIEAQEGTTVHQALREAGVVIEAACGGSGTCGMCKVRVNGEWRLACQTPVTEGMVLELPAVADGAILTDGISRHIRPDGSERYVMAFDVGTTTVAAYLMDGVSGALMAQRGLLNPQVSFGADVISRIQYVMDTRSADLRRCVLRALAELTEQAAAQAGIRTEEITRAAVVGNTAMHHLMLGIDPSPLITPPYMSRVLEALELPAEGLLPISKDGTIRVLPNIAGFVGADTVACLVSTDFGSLDQTTLLIDIGTNGEMVLGDGKRRAACSAAAGPAFEGARITCGMRGTDGAVDHVSLRNGRVMWHTIGGGTAKGICGSGLLELVAVLLKLGEIDESGRMGCGEYRLGDTDVVLTQRDVREVQLAKGAIRAGIDLLARYLGVRVEEIGAVYIAGAFGSHLDPAALCEIGMIPPCLSKKMYGIGNAAGAGARLCALSGAEYAYSIKLARETEFLELAGMAEFQDRFVDALSFGEGDEA